MNSCFQVIGGGGGSSGGSNSGIVFMLNEMVIFDFILMNILLIVHRHRHRQVTSCVRSLPNHRVSGKNDEKMKIKQKTKQDEEEKETSRTINVRIYCYLMCACSFDRLDRRQCVTLAVYLVFYVFVCVCV